MSAARRLRRGAKSAAVTQHLGKALQAVSQLQTLQGSLQGLGELETLIRESHSMVTALTDDYQALADRLESVESRLARIEESGKGEV